jgi:hypothetical protein
VEIELNDGTSVRFCNGGSLSKAAWDFTTEASAEDVNKHLHVYMSLGSGLHGFDFMCAGRTLSEKRRIEAEKLVQEKIASDDVEKEKLLQKLLANTDGIIEQMQGSVHDKCDAPVHVRRALGFDLRRGSKPTQRSWADVKAEIARLRGGVTGAVPTPAKTILPTKVIEFDRAKEAQTLREELKQFSKEPAAG